MEILNQFGVQPILLAAQVVNFLILLFILKRFLYKPLLKVLDERKKKIADSLKNAEEIEKRLLMTEEEKEKILAKTQVEAQKLLDETKKEIEAMKEEGRLQSEALAAQIIKKGEESAQAQMERMEVILREKAGEMVVIALQKVTGKIITKEDQKKLIEREVRQLS